jgi:integrase
LPAIRFHDLRHTAATLARMAGLDVKLVSEQLGHSTTDITQNLYQHVLLVEHHDAAAKVVELLPRRRRDAEESTG